MPNQQRDVSERIQDFCAAMVMSYGQRAIPTGFLLGPTDWDSVVNAMERDRRFDFGVRINEVRYLYRSAEIRISYNDFEIPIVPQWGDNVPEEWRRNVPKSW